MKGFITNFGAGFTSMRKITTAYSAFMVSTSTSLKATITKLFVSIKGMLTGLNVAIAGSAAGKKMKQTLSGVIGGILGSLLTGIKGLFTGIGSTIKFLAIGTVKIIGTVIAGIFSGLGAMVIGIVAVAVAAIDKYFNDGKIIEWVAQKLWNFIDGIVSWFTGQKTQTQMLA
jgi:hypothetical protein